MANIVIENSIKATERNSQYRTTQSISVIEAVERTAKITTKDATGSQKLRFALGNIRGEVSRLARQAIADSQGISLIYRSYTSSDLGAPAENPLHMTVTAVTEQAGTVDITAGFFDLIDTQFPRDIYDSEFAPGLKYLD